MQLKSSNPAMAVLDQPAFRGSAIIKEDGAMTLNGTVNKSILLAVLLIVSAGVAWQQISSNPPMGGMLAIVGCIGALILGLVTRFKMDWAPITAPLYSVAKGICLGAISLMYETMYGGGLVIQAVMATFAALFACLFAYRMGWVRVTDKFRGIVLAATLGIGVLYLISFVLSFFNIQIPLIFGSGPVGLVFSLVVIAVACLNLFLDFDFIESASLRGTSPKYMEWYAGFALMVTMVWLYLEILRFLAKLRRRD